MKQIGLWLDKTSEPGNASWIVSLDEVDELGGNTLTTTTIDAYPADDYDGAKEAALAQGQKRGLAVVETDGRGQSEILEAAPEK